MLDAEPSDTKVSAVMDRPPYDPDEADRRAIELAMAPTRELIGKTMRVSALQAAVTMWAPRGLNGSSETMEQSILQTADHFLAWLLA